jgi:hypothetical protein
MKYFNGLNMGEGIAGPDTIGLSTTVIYSCMGIALVNTATRTGGLYHYPANALGNANVTATLRQMINDIRPDQVHVTPAATDAFGRNGSDRDDIAGVVAYLRATANVVPVQEAAANAAQLVWQAAGPVYNVQPANAPQPLVGDPTAVSAETRTTMSSGARQLEAGIWYYGGDGETDGVLNQGLPAPKPKKTTQENAKGCCTVM